MEKLPGKGMVTASSLIMLIWGLVNAGYYDIAKLVLADEPSTKAVVCGVVAGIASLAAIIGGIFGIAGSNKVAKASSFWIFGTSSSCKGVCHSCMGSISGDTCDNKRYSDTGVR